MLRNKCLSTNPKLNFDEACLDINSDIDYKLFSQYSEIVKCKIQEWEISKSYLIQNSQNPRIFRAEFNNKSCSKILVLNEHTRYGWNITNDSCSDIYIKEPGDIEYLPILCATIIFIIISIIWYMLQRSKCGLKNGSKYLNCLKSTSPGNECTETLKCQNPLRIKSVDVFRGFCIISMIFVHSGGGRFMWLLGFSLMISLQSRLSAKIPRRQILRQIIKRSFILICIGIIMNSRQYGVANTPFSGVLQRLGIIYLFVGILEIIFNKLSTTGKFDGKSCIEDLLNAWPQWLVILCLVGLHTCVTFLMKVPGCPTGYLGPGGPEYDGNYENCTGGAAGYIDRIIFRSHMRYSTHVSFMPLMEFDANGILGTLTSIFTVYMGVQAARTFYTYKTFTEKNIRWITWSTITGIAAGILCNFSKNGGVIPLNRRLFSLSFALASSSLAFTIESILYILIDIRNVWSGKPFYYAGMNAILIYVTHLIFLESLPFAWAPFYNTHTEYLIMNLWATCLWIGISVYLYKKQIFLKI